MNLRVAVLGAALGAAACHPHTVATAASPKREAAPTEKKPKPHTTGTDATPVPRTPEADLQEGELRSIQEALGKRDLLQGKPSGSLDEPTRRALRRFQRDQDLPETGLPDHETVAKLGLDPKKVFVRRGAVAGP